MKTRTNIDQAVTCIQDGGVILCPTDTIWGLSADARNYKAVDKVFQIKNRPEHKSLIVLVSSIEMLKEYIVDFPTIALNLIQDANRPTSIIYPQGKGFAKNVMASNGSIAIRLVSEGFVHDLVKLLGFPIVSSSANKSGDPSPTSFTLIEQSILEEVDFIVKDLSLENPENQASSIFLIEGDTAKQIR